MKLLVLYDADCGFCTWSVGVAQGRVFRADCEATAWQSVAVTKFGLTPVQCQERLHVVQGRSVYAGAAAVAQILRVSRVPWPVLGGLMCLPGVAWLSERLYDLVARNRHRFPSGTATCRLSSGDSIPPTRN